MKRSMFARTLRDRKRASWISEQIKVEDMLVTFMNKKWIVAVSINDLPYNMEYQSDTVTTHCGSQGKERTQWRSFVRGQSICPPTGSLKWWVTALPSNELGTPASFLKRDTIPSYPLPNL